VPGKRHSSKEVAGKLREVEALLGEGKSLSEATKTVGVSRQTLYRWRGGRRHSPKGLPKSLRDLEEENARLRRLVTDLLLQKMAMEDELSKE
jgi:transposase-like protein